MTPVRTSDMNDQTILPAAAPAAGTKRKTGGRPAWLLPTGLITLGMIPIVANGLRRAALAAGAGGSATDDVSPALPLPVLVHILTATVFVILGALQFSAGLRRRRRSWHRISGRVVVVAGLLAAVSGLWLAVSSALQDSSGALLFLFRLLAGSGMLLFIVLGFVAIRGRRDIQRHRAWMIRSFALGLGAATQVFTLGFGEAIFGKSELSVALLNGAGWVINLTVAELAIRRRPRRRGRPFVAKVTALS